MKTDKELLTVEEAAALLQVTDQTVRNAISADELKAYKRFGRWYILTEDVFSFIRSGPTNKAAPAGSASQPDQVKREGG